MFPLTAFKSRCSVHSFQNFVTLCKLATFTLPLDLHESAKDDGREWADGIWSSHFLLYSALLWLVGGDKTKPDHFFSCLKPSHAHDDVGTLFSP